MLAAGGVGCEIERALGEPLEGTSLLRIHLAYDMMSVGVSKREMSCKYEELPREFNTDCEPLPDCVPCPMASTPTLFHSFTKLAWIQAKQ